MTLRIKLFGSLELERDGRPLARFASRKSGELFAYLALARKAPHTREHLAGVFWGDSAEERARHTLNTTLWRINRVLEPPESAASERGYLRITPQHIGFNAASGVWLDVAEFETRCELAEQSEGPTRFTLYAQAINLYRGDLLADCYEDWCIVERERLQGLYVRALAQLMAHNSGNAEYDLAIDCARRIPRLRSAARRGPPRPDAAPPHRGSARGRAAPVPVVRGLLCARSLRRGTCARNARPAYADSGRDVDARYEPA